MQDKLNLVDDLKLKYSDFMKSESLIDEIESKWQEAIQQDDFKNQEHFEKLWDSEYKNNHALWMEIMKLLQMVCDCDFEVAKKIFSSDRFKSILNGEE